MQMHLIPKAEAFQKVIFLPTFWFLAYLIVTLGPSDLPRYAYIQKKICLTYYAVRNTIRIW